MSLVLCVCSEQPTVISFEFLFQDKDREITLSWPDVSMSDFQLEADSETAPC